MGFEGTRTQRFLAAKKVLARHPGYSPQEVADELGTRVDLVEDVFRQAANEAHADAMEAEQVKRAERLANGP